MNSNRENDNVIHFPVGGRGGQSDFMAEFGDVIPRRPEPELLPLREAPVTYGLRIDLAQARPQIWRRLEVASDLTLDRLHEVIQRAMGWEDYHLHHFQTVSLSDPNGLPFLTQFDLDEDADEQGTLENDVRLDQVLAEPGDQLFYEYDFGDSWEHVIRLESVRERGERVARCVGGEHACPPEDIGGIETYNELLEMREARRLGGDVDEEMASWLPEDFDPTAFDVDEADGLLVQLPVDPALLHPALRDIIRRVGGEVRDLLQQVVHLADLGRPHELQPEEMVHMVAHYQALLREVGDDGITLTSAGWLPPAVVGRLWHAMGLDGHSYGKGNRENQSVEVADLRSSATALGLVRKNRGRLLLTSAGRRLVERPTELWWHIVGRLPLGRQPFEKQAGALRLLDLAAPDAHLMDLVAGDIMTALGWRADGVAEIDRWTVYQGSGPTADVLRAMRCWGDLDFAPTEPGSVLARIALQAPERRHGAALVR